MTAPTAPQVHPERQKRVNTALQLFSVSAWVTGVFLIILVIRMVAEYIIKVEIPSWATIIAIVHGWVYMIYLLATMNLGLKARWKPQLWITTALAGVVPFLSFFVESTRRKEVKAAFNL